MHLLQTTVVYFLKYILSKFTYTMQLNYWSTLFTIFAFNNKLQIVCHDLSDVTCRIKNWKPTMETTNILVWNQYAFVKTYITIPWNNYISRKPMSHAKSRLVCWLQRTWSSCTNSHKLKQERRNNPGSGKRSKVQRECQLFKIDNPECRKKKRMKPLLKKCIFGFAKSKQVNRLSRYNRSSRQANLL